MEMEKYKKLLLQKGFIEAKEEVFRFYKMLTAETAFIVNLYKTKNGIGVLYGFSTVSVYPIEREYFEKCGKTDDDCNLRYYITISDEADERKATQQIEDIYILYNKTEKTELLNIVKERRKQFLQNFSDLLKPLGFKKKGNKWINKLPSGYFVVFEAQKSAYSDQYYLNISIELTEKKNDKNWGCCYYTRVVIANDGIYNWQLMEEENLKSILEETKNILTPILDTGFDILGKNEEIWKHCICAREKCSNCWVEKNMRECQKTAWYLDDGILLEGKVSENRFYPNTRYCGFDTQMFTDDMIDKEIFFNLEKAFTVCGLVKVVKE